MTAPSTKRTSTQKKPSSTRLRNRKLDRKMASNAVKLRMWPTRAMIGGMAKAPVKKPAKYAEPLNPISVCDRPSSLARNGKKVMCKP